MKRRHKKPRRKRRANALDGCNCDGCDNLDGCDGCDCNFNMLSLGTLLLLVPFLRATPDLRPRSTVAGRGGVVLIRAYQRLLSRHLPTQCRYLPSCSEYGAQAVRRYGLLNGSRLIATRIKRCTRGVPLGTPDPVR
ncbi:membrane protein insertion efficiency factor YidD [Cryptosporangium sp. NPDC048952]|uniref:membrane protein insertion efficiency factor YidD n=1 Tax=Cryptosporangium sp. NPDC048952 TaxID=3363961 RepID=UPI0037183143